jgi:long-chain acyl-CoA synthetase
MIQNLCAGYLSDKTFTKVAIICENRVEWVCATYAAWAFKASIVPIDYLSAKEELAYILEDSKPEVIFASNKTLANLPIDILSYTPYVINVDDIGIETELSPKANKYLERVENIGEDMEAMALIIYTSGTTGSPKGVMLSFKNIYTNVQAVSLKVEIYHDYDKVLAFLPLHHAFPLVGCMVIPFCVGATMVFVKTMNPSEIVSAIKDNKVSIIIGVPRFYEMIVKGILDKINKSSIAKTLYKFAEKANSMALSKKLFKKVHDGLGGNLNTLVAGGAALDNKVGSALKTLGFEVLEGYGMTEAGPMITFTRPGAVLVGSPGPAVPTVEMKIDNGEIIARGNNIMMGYYNRPEETAQIIKNGWLYTGDKGSIDENGFLHISGRTKEIIVLSNGKNVNPVEVDFQLSAIVGDSVIELATFEKNNSIAAMFYPNFPLLQSKGIENIEEYFRTIVAEKYNSVVSSYKKINGVHIIDRELPKTRLSKVKRFALPELCDILKKQAKFDIAAQSQEFIMIKKYIEENKSIEVLPNSHFDLDLGFDSLERITLMVFVNVTFGLTIKDEQMASFVSIDKLVEFIVANKTTCQEAESVNWSDILKNKINISLPKTWFTQTIIKNLSRLLFSFYFRIKAKGLENIPQGPVIIAPNHQSYIDGLFITSFMKNATVRKTYFYAKQKHVKNIFLKFLADTNNVIIMDLNKDLNLSLQKMAAVLEKGKNLIIFPEGTRSQNGALGEFKKTFAILSRELNVPIVPVAIDGAWKALPSGSRFPKPFKRISIEFLNPVYPESHTYDSLKDSIKSLIASKINFSESDK